MPEPIRNTLDVILELLAPVAGRFVLDIGCGRGAFCTPLEQAGATWRGLDPIRRSKVGLDIDTATAENMPYPDASFDAAICVCALHHVPVHGMERALVESVRVLRSKAELVVIEPVGSDASSRVMAVVDDETYVCEAAQRAMDKVVTDGVLVQKKSFGYRCRYSYSSFEAFCESVISVSPKRRAAVENRKAELRQRFEEASVRDGPNWCLSHGMTVRVFLPAGARAPTPPG